MRRYFIEQAREKGFEVIDLQSRFVDHFAEHHHKFEFPTDNHWNALGHEVAGDAISHSALYHWFSTLAR
jgi:hypothetical protein